MLDDCVATNGAAPVIDFALHARSLGAAAGLTLRDVRVEVREWNSAFSLVREGVGVVISPLIALT